MSNFRVACSRVVMKHQQQKQKAKEEGGMS